MLDQTKIKVSIGILFSLPLLLIRVITYATTEKTWFFGKNMHIGCWFKDHFGYDCPFCGMTRSVILTLHGDFQSAFQLHIAGPLFVSGILLFSFLMLFSAIFPKYSADRKIFGFFSLYFGLATLLSYGFWIIKINS